MFNSRAREENSVIKVEGPRYVYTFKSSLRAKRWIRADRMQRSLALRTEKSTCYCGSLLCKIRFNKIYSHSYQIPINYLSSLTLITYR